MNSPSFSTALWKLRYHQDAPPVFHQSNLSETAAAQTEEAEMLISSSSVNTLPVAGQK